MANDPSFDEFDAIYGTQKDWSTQAVTQPKWWEDILNTARMAIQRAFPSPGERGAPGIPPAQSPGSAPTGTSFPSQYILIIGVIAGILVIALALSHK